MKPDTMEPIAGLGRAAFASRSGLRRFTGLVDVVSTSSLDEVMPCLRRIETAVDAGLHAAGFLAYEAAPAFDSALVAHDGGDFPFLWFGLYEDFEDSDALGESSEPFRVGPWRPLVTEDAYRHAIHRIRGLIEAGDTYQVNYTFPSTASFEGDAWSWFRQLCAAQGTDHGAFIDAGRHVILSASPELFFRLDGERLIARPMKGTSPRGRWPEEDAEFRDRLMASEKDRAENVMIVDLLRNDMGRVSKMGSVSVESLFDAERYETLWQLTSTITSRTTASVPEILRAMYPSGSVTGAPKVRTTEIIRELEPYPRGVYCGAVGWWSPGRQAEFNVAIRTVTVDTEAREARYSVGGGITWSSTADGEYDECRVKAAILQETPPDFELLESMLADGQIFLLEEHLQRLKASADYFGYAVDIASLRQALKTHVAEEAAVPRKVRLLVTRDGAAHIESAPITPTPAVRLGLARDPVDEQNRFLFHKTTHRAAYEEALATRPDCDDVLLHNTRGEITESTRANLAIQLHGQWFTPPISSGLLAGTMRAQLLRENQIHERVLHLKDLKNAESIRLINSVRRWIDVEFVP